MKMNWIFKTFVFFLGLEASASLVSVSVTGTANANAMGYTQGESYTFTWVVNDGYTGSTSGDPENSDEFSSTKNRWFSILTADPWLWTSVSGDGLTGTYSRPSIFYDSPWDQIQADASGLRFWAGNNDPSSTSMGLMVGNEDVYDIIAYELKIPGLDYSDTSFVNPAVYLERYVGTYTSTGGSIYFDDWQGESPIEFTVTNVTIGVVPEPSTILLFGIGGLGSWLLRRNRMKTREDAE